ncbi:MAG: S-layer homology domain-containing protein [Ruminococcaceae bacterium]|nr:S-layer homology domain-containing protein [Oscillospiraceae bacterium]
MKRFLSLVLVFLFAALCLPISVMADTPAFSDVPEDAYYAEAVAWAVNKEITTGTGNGKFSPATSCNRAQAVTFLWRAAGSPEPGSDIMSFNDVSEDAYYYKAVLWAVEAGVTAGTGNGSFSPVTNCNRAQIVTFLWRAMGTPEAEGENPFADVNENAYYLKAVLWAVENSITTGTGNKSFSPAMNCNRAQIVTFLYRCFKEAPHEHSFGEWEITLPSSCLTEGIRTRSCECGETETTAIPVTDHSFGNWEETLAPTYDTEGVEVRVCGVCGTAEERALPLLVPDPFVIISNPEAVDANIGDTVTFKFETAGGKPSVSYQWQIKYGADSDFTDIFGANDSEYSFTANEEHRKNNAEFRCVAADTKGGILISETVFVSFPLWFGYEDKVIDIEPNGNSVLNADAMGGSAPYTYEWEVYDCTGGEWISVSTIERFEFGESDADSFTVTVSGCIAEYYDTFRCKVTDSNGDFAYSPETKFLLTGLAFANDLPDEIRVTDVREDVYLYIKLASDFGIPPYTYKIEYYSDRRNKWSTIKIETKDSYTMNETFLSDKEDRDYNGRYRITVTDSSGNKIVSNEVSVIFS